MTAQSYVPRRVPRWKQLIAFSVMTVLILIVILTATYVAAIFPDSHPPIEIPAPSSATNDVAEGAVLLFEFM